MSRLHRSWITGGGLLFTLSVAASLIVRTGEAASREFALHEPAEERHPDHEAQDDVGQRLRLEAESRVSVRLLAFDLDCPDVLLPAEDRTLLADEAGRFGYTIVPRSDMPAETLRASCQADSECIATGLARTNSVWFLAGALTRSGTIFRLTLVLTPRTPLTPVELAFEVRDVGDVKRGVHEGLQQLFERLAGKYDAVAESRQAAGQFGDAVAAARGALAAGFSPARVETLAKLTEGNCELDHARELFTFYRAIWCTGQFPAQWPTCEDLGRRLFSLILGKDSREDYCRVHPELPLRPTAAWLPGGAQVPETPSPPVPGTTPPPTVPEHAALDIASAPPGAHVTLDDQPHGVTPVEIPALPPGSHRVQLDLYDYRAWSRPITFLPGGNIEVHVDLKSMDEIQEEEAQQEVQKKRATSATVVAGAFSLASIISLGVANAQHAQQQTDLNTYRMATSATIGMARQTVTNDFNASIASQSASIVFTCLAAGAAAWMIAEWATLHDPTPEAVTLTGRAQAP